MNQRSLTLETLIHNLKHLVLIFQTSHTNSDLVITNRTLTLSDSRKRGNCDEHEMRSLNLEQVKFILKTFI
jgi:hypothetical protein